MNGLSFSEATDEELRQPGFLPDILNREDRQDRKVFVRHNPQSGNTAHAGRQFLCCATLTFPQTSAIMLSLRH
jgi:hypothetical protein